MIDLIVFYYYTYDMTKQSNYKSSTNIKGWFSFKLNSKFSPHRNQTSSNNKKRRRMSIQLFAVSLAFPAFLHALPVQNQANSSKPSVQLAYTTTTAWNTTNTGNTMATGDATTATTSIDEDQIMRLWKIVAACIGVYLVIALIFFFVMECIREKQHKDQAKKTRDAQGTSRSKRQLKQGELKAKTKEESTKSGDLVRSTTNVPGVLLPRDSTKQKKPPSSRMRPKFFIDEDVTQELTVSLRQTPEMDYVETAHGGSETSLYRVPSYPIQLQSPPSTFSGTETVPQTETLSGTQQGSDSRSRRSESKSFRSGSTTSSRSGTTTSSRTSSTSSTLTPSRTTSSSTSSWSSSSSSSSSSSRSSGSSSRTMRR